MDTASWFRWFASSEVRGASPCLEQWAEGIAEDQALVALIDELPEPNRQPNLVLAAARFVGIPPTGFDRFRERFIADWPAIRAVALGRRTQTNEVGRCAVLVPLLAALPQPLALLEVGASAGLCLYPDRFSYVYGDGPQIDPEWGPGASVLPCATSGPVPVPACLPEIAWRTGIDLDPVDIGNVDEARWLEALVWPEQGFRRDRLKAASEVARAEPPTLIAGDLLSTLEATAATAPSDATLVVFHSAVLAYVDVDDRAIFARLVQGLPGHWIANEGAGVLPYPDAVLPVPSHPTRSAFVIALDGVPVAHAGPHGEWLDWFGDPDRSAGSS